MLSNKAVKFIAAGTAVLVVTSTAYAAEFEDTKNHWGAEYINILSERGIMSGMEDGMFHPDESVTTEQFIAMAIRTCKGDIAPTDDTWSSGYLDYALSSGIIEDYDALNRSEPIERSAAARIAHETLLKEYGEADEAEWLSAEKLKDLYDCHTCVNHIAQMYSKGIMTGRTEVLFDNYGNLTRAEAAAVIVRMTDSDKRLIPEKSERNETKHITAEDALKIPGAVIIDVRTPEEYEVGHMDGSINIPVDEINKNPYIVSENRTATVILYCSKGYRSAAAAHTLIEAGYTNVYTISAAE